MQDPRHTRYRFDDFELDIGRAMLSRGGDVLRLRPKSFDVLVYLVEHPGRIVPRAELLDALWGKAVVTDDSVTQCLIEIRKVLGDEAQDIIRTVPRKGYVFERAVDVLSASDTPRVAATSPARFDNRLLWLIAATAIVVSVGFAGWQLFGSGPSADARSVAVLPFVDMSAGSDSEYLGDGFAESLLHNLAQIPELKVAARTSSFALKGSTADIRDVGQKLRVAHVLEGSVRREGTSLRITAQLVRVDDGFHIWSETYDRELTEVFDIQDEIAGAVGVKLLATVLNPVEGSDRRAIGTRDFSAYDAYLRGMAEARKASFESLQAAEIYLREALDHDPDFLDAKAELAELIVTQADTGMRPLAEGIALHRQLAEEVLKVDPLHPKAGSTLISVQTMTAMNEGDLSAWQTAVPRLREIIAASPDQVDAKIWLGFLLGRFGDKNEAVAVLEEVLETDPLNLLVHEFLASTLSRLRRHEAARDVLLRAADIDPGAPNTWKELGAVALRLGDAELAIDSFIRAHESDPADAELVGEAAGFLYQIGLPDEALELHRRAIEIDAGSEVAKNLAMLGSLARGELDIAVGLARDILEEGVPERPIAWPQAMRIFVFTSVARGTVDDDLRLLERHLPGFSNLENFDVPWLTNLTRIHALDLLAEAGKQDQIREYGEAYFRGLEQMGMARRDVAHLHVSWLLSIGNMDAAVEVGLRDLLTKPVSAMLMWRLFVDRPLMRAWAAQPSIREALQQLEREEDEMRRAVRRYLADRGEPHSRAAAAR